ncbi:MAG TPA: fused MFS/spermidine synthase [Solirubrobacteraceae bacterium]|nr:fused MFS/spermidine synthase [Solirubrobacteraceae bacterium]
MRRLPEPKLELTVFVVGTGSLGAEIAVSRLMAPYFGSSTIIWANIIGVVLVALSLGYWLGGRLADRNPTANGMYRLILVAALLLAAIPFVADPILGLAVGALDSIAVGAFVGSLFGVLALVAVPVLMLGAIAPYAVRLGVERVDESGSVSGRLYAISTLGSLTGNFLASLVLIPFLGTTRAFLFFAFIIALVGVVGLARARFVLAPAALVALAAVPVGTVKAATPEGAEVVWEEQTRYQYARVVEFEDRERWLELNEGQAIHSIYEPDTVLTGNIWDEYLVAPFAVLDRPPERIAILGNAAGTTSRAYEELFPQTWIDGVEIDEQLTDVGRRLFDMNNPRLTTHTADARPWLRASEQRYDAILVDAYRQPYIPFYLTTKEFFELARERLKPGGVVMVNVGHPEGNDDLETVLGRTMAEVFPRVLRDPAEDTNTLLIATEDRGAGPARLRAAIPSLPAKVRPRAEEAASRLGPRLPGGTVYTDDHAPVEWLIDASILEVAAQGER